MLFQNLTVGFALHEIILDKGKPCDYRFLEINPAFEKLTGLEASNLIGKTNMEVLPTTESYWIDTYGQVALTGKSINFENYSRELNKYYQVSAYSPEPGKFATIFLDVTERKKEEEEIRKSKEMMEQFHKHLTEVRENERAVISREIHDQLGQSMTALKLDLNWLQGKITATTEVNTKLENMVELITSTIRDVQRISAELRPGILDDLGLAATIEWYAEEFEARTEIKTVLDLDDVQTKCDNNNLAIFRILQEALTNVIRHAYAKNVYVSLHEIDKVIILEIIDDGIGIPVEKIKSNKSLGLLGINDRVKQAGGNIVIQKGDVAGTVIRLTIPVEGEK